MKCPGQDTRYWRPGDIYEAPCPQCGKIIEFFKDDSTRRCKSCGKQVLNPRLDFGCAAYCAYADQCLQELPPELLAQRKNLLKDRAAVEMKRYFGQDFKRIGHAMKVARYAEKIIQHEKGDLAVVMLSAYLHDIGIKEAERRYQSSAARYQEELGPPVARAILEKLDADPRLVDEVCDIIGHHHSPRPEETGNFKILYDADLLVNMEDANKNKPFAREELFERIDAKFFTQTGKKLARSVFQLETV